jgi:exonuclease III
LWCGIDRTILNRTKYIFVCGVYIPSEMSPYFDDEIFEEMENYIVNVSKKGNIMLLGDYNACTSNLKDFVSKEDLHK